MDPEGVREGGAKTGLTFEWSLNRGVEPHPSGLDVTGGTVSMSIAAFLAARQTLRLAAAILSWPNGRMDALLAWKTTSGAGTGETKRAIGKRETGLEPATFSLGS